MEIPLSRGKVAIVDAQDYEYLMQWKWYCSNKGYATHDVIISSKNPRIVKKIPMHDKIMNPSRGNVIDHKNHDRLDNTRANLRECSYTQNSQNLRIYSNKKTSKYKGVFYEKDRNLYRAIIQNEKKSVKLGRFTSEIDAARAYNEAAKKYFGEFACLNQI